MLNNNVLGELSLSRIDLLLEHKDHFKLGNDELHILNNKRTRLIEEMISSLIGTTMTNKDLLNKLRDIDQYATSTKFNYNGKEYKVSRRKKGFQDIHTNSRNIQISHSVNKYSILSIS
jgi:dsRNA-specific ribonuclease